MKIAYNFAFWQPLLWISIFLLTSKKLLCWMPNIDVLANYFLPSMSNYTLIASKQSIQLLTYMMHTLFGSQWFGVFWQQFGSKLCYIWQWAPKITWQPWSLPWRRPTAECSEARFFFAVMTVTFLHISRKPPFRSWTWLYHQKANEKTFPTISCPYGNIVNFSHTSLIHFYLTMCHWNEWRKNYTKPPSPRSTLIPI